jgi:hypothetical protein
VASNLCAKKKNSQKVPLTKNVIFDENDPIWVLGFLNMPSTYGLAK